MREKKLNIAGTNSFKFTASDVQSANALLDVFFESTDSQGYPTTTKDFVMFLMEKAQLFADDETRIKWQNTVTERDSLKQQLDKSQDLNQELRSEVETLSSQLKDAQESSSQIINDQKTIQLAQEDFEALETYFRSFQKAKPDGTRSRAIRHLLEGCKSALEEQPGNFKIGNKIIKL